MKIAPIIVRKKVVSGIIIYKEKILLLQRDNSEGIKDPECWQLPGGGVERGETLDIAIRRELKEEIGITPKSLTFLSSSEDQINHVYYANLEEVEVSGIKKGREGKDLQFFSLEEMSNIPLTRKLKWLLETQKDRLRKVFLRK